MFRMTEVELKNLLLDAKEKHTCFERVSGPDPDWAGWYANYMIKVMEREFTPRKSPLSLFGKGLTVDDYHGDLKEAIERL